MFLQIHFLTSYHATLLNRDDVGLAKRISFGGQQRLRVSSQCQKRHWREWMLDHTELPRGYRTRYFFSRIVRRRLVAAGMAESLATSLTFELGIALGLFSPSDDPQKLAMKQPVLFGKPEADFFVDLIRKAAAQGDEKSAVTYLQSEIKNSKANFKALLEQAGLSSLQSGFEGALFGRFVTSDIMTRVDAPVHVAHAFTTHALDTEVDFFTVVDDLSEDETGAAHANDAELGGGVYYGYVVVDIPLLISNLTGCERQEWREHVSDEARELLRLLIHAIAQVSPGAKLGATAPYAKAECVLIEVGQEQPRSLANAFLQPIKIERRDTQAMQLSIGALKNYMEALDVMYGPGHEQRFAAVLPIYEWDGTSENLPLREAIDRSLDTAFGDQR
ncbi:MAG TPA: type I-E CRISPR-associated protein Cas7/Cse4/CasC [Firmicutes bacterium]|jgi:CRISPR system Cascade subunit CasC|nr:type I-E CRISPR-associated protein Cas7/Cse4/CasC [Bacillota bacterium]